MADRKTQYQHYIPRFILNRFAYTDIPVRKLRQGNEEQIREYEAKALHIFDMSTGCFRIDLVGKTCGAEDLYHNTIDPKPDRIEELFSDLESKTGSIFADVNKAITKGQAYIDILEKDIYTLFRFMDISSKRSVQFKDEMEDPYRENDFMFQRMFDHARNCGRASEPRQFWLDSMLYLLETEHDTILADAERSDENIIAGTYKHLVERYALQIWKAADGCEFFLNEKLVDFEGDTQSCLGTEITDSGYQLTWMTWEDRIHIVLPVSPDAAVVFCDESRCRESPFAESMHRIKPGWPQNSLLKNAPHKDIVNVDKLSARNRRKRWPAATAWRVNIGELTQSYVIVRRRAAFEKARRELASFSRERTQAWTRQGVRFGGLEASRKPRDADQVLPLSNDRVARIVDQHLDALGDVLNLIKTTGEPLERTKDNMWKAWLAVRALEAYRSKYCTASPGLETRNATKDSHILTIHPAHKAALEAAYAPQPLNFRNLVAIDFAEFVDHAISDATFVKLTSMIGSKIAEVVQADSFEVHRNEHVSSLPRSKADEETPVQSPADTTDPSEEDILKSPAFKSVVRAAQTFDVLKWMFDQRQDILATFIYQLTVPQEAMQPKIIRLRSPRT